MPDRSKVNLLTPREQEVLKLIAAGLSSKEIAAVLGIKVKTAVRNRTRVLEKLDLHCTADLTRYAMRNKLLCSNVKDEERLLRDLRRGHQKYMEALTSYDDFLNERENLELANSDSSELTRQLLGAERQRHAEYSSALRAWADLVLGSAESK
jgi:DNA-binding CsgD family transcriptional regulator